MRNVPTMDISGPEALEETFEICKKRKMTLILSHVNEQPYNVMKEAEITFVKILMHRLNVQNALLSY